MAGAPGQELAQVKGIGISGEPAVAGKEASQGQAFSFVNRRVGELDLGRRGEVVDIVHLQFGPGPGHWGRRWPGLMRHPTVGRPWSQPALAYPARGPAASDGVCRLRCHPLGATRTTRYAGMGPASTRLLRRAKRRHCVHWALPGCGPECRLPRHRAPGPNRQVAGATGNMEGMATDLDGPFRLQAAARRSYAASMPPLRLRTTRRRSARCSAGGLSGTWRGRTPSPARSEVTQRFSRRCGGTAKAAKGRSG